MTNANSHSSVYLRCRCVAVVGVRVVRLPRLLAAASVSTLTASWHKPRLTTGTPASLPPRRLGLCRNVAWYVFALLVSALFLSAIPFAAQAQERRCLLCHGKKDFRAKDQAGKERSLYVDEAIFRGSAHGKLSCVDCHLDTMELPHGKRLKQVNCGACHYRGRSLP